MSFSNTWPVPQSSAVTILTANPNVSDLKLEPSGMNTWTNSSGKVWIYLASDNGRISRIAVGDTKNDWQTHDYGSGGEFDFESIANAGDGMLLIGVEGGDSGGNYNYAHVKQLNPSDNSTSNIGTFTNNIWKLGHYQPSVGAGMEAFTFVPRANCPSSWGTPTGFNGFFLAAYQSRIGQADVYDLPPNSGGTVNATYVTTITVDNPNPTGYPNGLKISDFFFNVATNRLFVLYDDTVDALQQCTLGASRATSVYSAQTPKVGCEALTVIGDDVYIGLDQNPSQMTQNGYTVNYVFDYPNFL